MSYVHANLTMLWVLRSLLLELEIRGWEMIKERYGLLEVRLRYGSKKEALRSDWLRWKVRCG